MKDEKGKEILNFDFIRKNLMPGAAEDEVKVFMHTCAQTGLDPFRRQIYPVKRGNRWTIQTAIDGYRLIAERTAKYAPGKDSEFIYDEKGHIKAARAFVKKMTPDGTWHEVSSTAYWNEYAVANNPFWKQKPHIMIAKCAEALVLRKCFPDQFSGIYTEDEMGKADEKLEDESPFISLSQVVELTNFFALGEGLEERFLKYYKIEEITQLPSEKFEEALQNLKKSAKKDNGNGN